MLGKIRKLAERIFIGNSVPALVRWGKSVPRPVIRRIQDDAFREVVRYAARRQKFFARQLREHGVDTRKVRRLEDLKGIFTTARDLLTLPPEDFLCREQRAIEAGG